MATGSYNEVRAAVAHFTSQASEKLRRQKLVAGVIEVSISTDRFKDDPQYSNSLSLAVAPKSDSTIFLSELALKGLERIFRYGYRIRKAGVSLSSLDYTDVMTMPLWGREEQEKQRRLMTAIDAINAKHGRDAVRYGAFSDSGVWRTRFARRSPRYTTRWNEVCIVNS